MKSGKQGMIQMRKLVNRNNKKELNRNPGAEEYIEGTEKFNRELTGQT